ncbi:TPA: hypothetical protein ACX131_001757, partial [Citrobacter freundii]
PKRPYTRNHLFKRHIYTKACYTSILRAFETEISLANLTLQKNYRLNQNRTTPHPPAVFISLKFFSWDFLQTIPPARARAGDARRGRN